ncbi:MAG: hypothetical protein LBK56_01140 [Gracilibacteraceae bacterium]|jgi:hypothetical protein|nr:hypothetical protein [Gracilibacteraceae bacterium]
MKFDEGNLQLDFSAFISAIRFDDQKTNPYGLKSVDFVAETADAVYYLEVKDFQNPKSQNFQMDLQMLKDAQKDGKHTFCLEMGEKIKDSLLRQYAQGIILAKELKYLLLINLDVLGAAERGRLKAKISGHIPTGLNDTRFTAFTSISFELVTAEQLKTHGIVCIANP